MSTVTVCFHHHHLVFSIMHACMHMYICHIFLMSISSSPGMYIITVTTSSYITPPLLFLLILLLILLPILILILLHQMLVEQPQFFRHQHCSLRKAAFFSNFLFIE